MTIALASDHAGYPLKERIKSFLENDVRAVRDFGTFSQEPVDYPDVVRPAALAVAAGECQRGIIFGGSGNGEAIVANRVPGVRCAVCWNIESARLASAHNDANMISLGGRMIDADIAVEIVRTWLETPFEDDRHVRRIRKIDEPFAAG